MIESNLFAGPNPKQSESIICKAVHLSVYCLVEGGITFLEQEEGSSPKPTGGPALRSTVGLPALPLGGLVVNVWRWAPAVTIRVLLHHLQLGLNGSDLGARAEVICR